MNTVLTLVATLVMATLVIELDLSLYVGVAVVAIPVYAYILRRPALATAVLAAAPCIVFTTWASPAKILGLALIPPLMYRAIQRPAQHVGAPWLHLGMVGVLGWLQFCDLIGTSSANYDYVVTFVGCVATIAIMHQFLTTPAALAVFIWVQVAVLALVSLTVPLFVSLSDIEGMNRTGGLVGEPNGLGLTVGRLFPFTLALLSYHKVPKHLKLLLLVVPPAAIWALFASNSRSGTLVLATGVVGFALIASKSWSGRAIASAAVVIGGFVIHEVAPDAFHQRTIDILMSSAGLTESKVDIAEATSGRSTMNLLAIEAIVKSPFVGLGGGGFSSGNWSADYTGTAVHNVYLSLGAWGGLPAMLGVAAMHVAALVNALRVTFRAGSDRPLAAGCLSAGLATIASAVNSPVVFSVTDWTTLALCAFLPNVFSAAAQRVAAEGLVTRSAQGDRADGLGPSAPRIPAMPVQSVREI